MKTTETKTNPKTDPAAQDEKTPDRRWESFPKPRGWSMDWDQRGLVPGRPGTADGKPGGHHTFENPIVKNSEVTS